MSQQPLRNFDISTFRNDLINWYKAHHRVLPWRLTKDPYHIWVSEIMLQQTQVDTVIPYFEHFMTKYPTPTDLAEADEEDVLKTWEGLGYYSRARNLQSAVREVVANYDGHVPEDPKALGALKGIGPYTKGAILSIAFNQPTPAVDGNVMRVISRVLRLNDDIAKPATKKRIEQLVEELISPDDPSAFNQGIMDLGATICTPKQPACLLCPLQEHCQAFAAGVERTLPVKSKGKKQATKHYAAILIRNEHGQYVIEKRPDTGLLANLWQFPMIPIDDVGYGDRENWLADEYGIRARIDDETVGSLKHVFSHLIWKIAIYNAWTDEAETANDRVRFVDQADLTTYPFPVSHQKMLPYIITPSS